MHAALLASFRNIHMDCTGHTSQPLNLTTGEERLEIAVYKQQEGMGCRAPPPRLDLSRA